VEEYREELISRIAECNTVIDELSKNRAWEILVRDYERQRTMIDNSWHMIMDEKKLHELRITKFAVIQLVTTIDKYKVDLKTAQTELRKLDNPGKEIAKDFDNDIQPEKY